jgi:hypothetical protein
MSYLDTEEPDLVHSCVNKQQELEASPIDERLIVQPGNHLVGLESLGRKSIELTRWQIELTLGEQTEALSGRCSSDPRESECVFLDARPIHQVVERLVAHHK